MKVEKLVRQPRKPAKLFRVTNGDAFRLKDFDPDDTPGFYRALGGGRQPENKLVRK